MMRKNSVFFALAFAAFVCAAPRCASASTVLSELKGLGGDIAEPPMPQDPKPDNDLQPGRESEWTVMVYINGKTDPRGEVDQAIKSMEQAGSTKDVKIVVEASRNDWNDNGRIWSGSKRLFIANPEDNLRTVTLQSKERSDKDDWRNIAKFAVYAKKNFPARHYMVVLWDRAALKPLQKSSAGARDGDAEDAESSGAEIGGGGDNTVVEMGEVMQRISRTLRKKIDIFALDAGNMADASVNAQIYNNTEYIVSAQGDCFNLRYEKFLGALRKSPFMQGDDVAKSAVFSYRDYYSVASKKPTTLSAVKSEKMRELAQSLRSLSEKGRRQGDVSAMKKLRPLEFEFKDESGQTNTDFKDLGDFAKLGSGAKSGVKDAPLRQALKNIRRALSGQSLVIANGPTGKYRGKATGISVYLPKKDYKNEFDATALAKDSDWDKFAKKLAGKDGQGDSAQPAGGGDASGGENQGGQGQPPQDGGTESQE
ncbi:MAG: clostripain-related cysteine peptidase [Elusimicrobiales bacterium]